jgi:SAM-dependent methyltransferase
VLKANTDIVRCSDCGLFYTNPRIKDSLNREVISEQGELDIVRYNALKHWEIPRFNEELIKIEKVVRPGKILDVGCGNGNFLSCASQRGWEPYGVDLNPVSLEPCSKFGKIFIGTIFDAGFRVNYFDAIFSSSTFCYFTNPLEFLKEAFRILKPEGVIVITGIPNIKSLESRINQKYYIEPYPPEQVSYYFDRSHLKKLVYHTGLEIVSIRTSGLGRMILNRSSDSYSVPKKTRAESEEAFSDPISVRQKLYTRIIKSNVNGVLNLFSLGYHLTLFARKPK